MSVIIVGGHERMESVYKKVGKKYGCKVKVFTHMETNFQKRIGNADYIFMLSDVVSHKLVNTAMKVSKQRNLGLGCYCSYLIRQSHITPLRNSVP